MKAVIINDYNTQPVIADMPMPEVGDNDVLVKIHAAGVNPVDNLIIAGYLKAILPLKFPHILGNDVSGEVVETGKNVTGFKKGDLVYSRPNPARSGTFAEFIAINESELAIKPENLSHAEAASLPLVSLTAWQALEQAQVKENQKVLIQAGSGGVGSMAIQLAKHLGAYVTATTSAKNMDLVKSYGADQVINYQSEDFTQLLSDYDFVLDALGGDVLDKSFDILKAGGQIISLLGSENAEQIALEKNKGYRYLLMTKNGEQLAKITHLVEQKVVWPTVDRVYPLEEFQSALEYSATRRVKGKLVIKIV